MVFRKQQFDFVCKTTIGKLKRYSITPNTVKPVFLAKYIENSVLSVFVRNSAMSSWVCRVHQFRFFTTLISVTTLVSVTTLAGLTTLVVCEKRSKNTSKYSLISSSFYYCPHCGLEMTNQRVIKLLVRFSTYFYVRSEFL